MSAILQLHDLDVFYGGIQALRGVSLEVGAGELVTLVGANGAGKSTTLKTIAGLLRPRSGKVCFCGAELVAGAPSRAAPGGMFKPRTTGVSVHEIVSKGLALCPEGRRIFPNLTVDENLDLGAYIRTDLAQIKIDTERMRHIFPVLKARAQQLAGTLSGGEQQMLAIARALMSRPKLLMLDEPSMGLAPKLVSTIFAVLVELKKQGVTILLVEQNARQALEVADRGYVLETGRIVKHGSGKDLTGDPAVRKAYLGG